VRDKKTHIYDTCDDSVFAMVQYSEVEGVKRNKGVDVSISIFVWIIR
jgi:hypothetical protein